MSYNDFKVILNSKYGTGLNNNSLTYNFDWGMFHDGLYQVEATYVGENNQVDPANSAELSINFGTQRCFTAADQTSSQHICLLFPTLSSVANDGYLRCLSFENSPTIMQRPYGKTFTVFITNLDGTPYEDSAGLEPNEYILVLKFRFLQLNN